jgi:DNA ligase 1
MTELKEFIEKMRATSSSLEKVKIVKDASPFIHKILEYTYNPFKQYYVTSKTCKKNSDKVALGHHTLFETLDYLTTRKVTGHDAIKLVNRFATKNVDWDLIYKIIDKNLDIRAGDKVINKAIPGLIPTFSVTLAKEYEGKCDWNDGWYASRKLDGVRCLAVVDEKGKCTLYSRMGKEFTTLNKIKEAIESTNIINTVFDGEICLIDDNGDEDFQSIMKQLRRKDHQIEKPIFKMFDMLHKPDFDNKKSTEILSERLIKLRTFIDQEKVNSGLHYLGQYLISDNDHFNYWSEKPKQEGWEGIVLRKDVGYEGKRTKNLLKVKSFHDAEYEVLDFDIDEHEVVRFGRQDTIPMLAQVYIMHKGHKVKVGSGFTQEQRLQYTDGSIVGKIICVQYFSETTNDKGGISLRFPTVKHIYDGERDM